MESVIANRTERKKEETKQKIIGAAMDLFYRQGFDETTVDQIAERADVAKGTIYNHFPVKEAIISEYVHRTLREKSPEVFRILEPLPDTRSRLITVLRMSIEWVEAEFNKDLFRKYFAYRLQILEQSIRDQSLRSDFHGALVKIIGLGQETGEIRKDLPTEVLAHQVESLHTFTVAAWLAIPEFSVFERTVCNVDLFLNGAMDRGNK